MRIVEKRIVRPMSQKFKISCYELVQVKAFQIRLKLNHESLILSNTTTSTAGVSSVTLKSWTRSVYY